MNPTTPQPEPTTTAPRPAAARRLTVALAGKPHAMAAPGGGEIQMLATAEALPSVGVDARLWQPEQDQQIPPRTDCLHLFGSLPEHLPLVEAARRRGTPVVLSTIAWFELANAWREPRSIAGRLAACGRFMARATCPRLPSWRRRLYHRADLLLPNSNAEARQLVRYFGVPWRRIHVVPNGADPRFTQADPEPFVSLAGRRDFVLYPGRIEPRKNQLGFLEAMRGTGVPIVVLGDMVPGDIVPGCRWYLARCRRAAGRNVRFLPRIDHHDPLLASAYAACRCMVLVSWYETPGLAALEAGISGTPLVLPAGGCAQEYFGPLARYVRPNDRPGIRRAVLAAVQQDRNQTLAEMVRTSFTWTAAAAATRDAYVRALQDRY